MAEPWPEGGRLGPHAPSVRRPRAVRDEIPNAGRPWYPAPALPVRAYVPGCPHLPLQRAVRGDRHQLQRTGKHRAAWGIGASGRRVPECRDAPAAGAQRLSRPRSAGRHATARRRATGRCRDRRRAHARPASVAWS